MNDAAGAGNAGRVAVAVARQPIEIGTEFMERNQEVPGYDADMVLRLATLRHIVFLVALIPAAFVAGLAAWALLFPEPRWDAEGHLRCPLPSEQVAGSYLLLSLALVCLAVALGWLGSLGVRRRLVLILMTVPLAAIGTAIVPSHFAC
jgi:hypothetical protein